MSLIDRFTNAYYQRDIEAVRHEAALVEHRLRRQDTLFDAIAHGDVAHRTWLRAAIEAHFNGLPIPEAPCKST